jgi:hypothetical protein
MSNRVWIIALMALLQGACMTTVGPFVSDIQHRGDKLIVEECTIVKTGEQIFKGSCKTKTIKVASATANRAPRYLYLPNSEVGEVQVKKRDNKVKKVRTSTFSYTAAPGLVFALDVQLRGDRVVKDSVRVGITLDSVGPDKLTGAAAFIMVVDGRPLQEKYLNWKGRKRGELNHETLRGLISARWIVGHFREIKTLEIQFGGRNYALPSNAVSKLNDFMRYMEARLPASTPSAT